MIPDFKTDPCFTVGTPILSAWTTSESTCRMQTRDPAITKQLRKLPDCRQVGYGVAGGYLAIFALPYTLPWVARNVIEKFTPQIPKENEGCFGGIGAGATFEAETV